MKNLWFLFILIEVIYGLNSQPIVNISSGIIEGFTKSTINGRQIFAFEGVPYARPPLGKYRFKEAVPAKPWEGVWKARTIFKCLQYNQYTKPGEDYVLGEEDCLYLNIYTPKLDQTANLDVIVYIHGGAFMFNYGAMQGPEYLLDKDVVFVNFNYRLGPLGFLSTEDNEIPSNIGIRDQIFALKWIRDNIQYFGGNSNSVTITGMSAGAASVHLHYLSPKSKGLFHRGVSQSGTALNPWVLMEEPLAKARKLAAMVGCPTPPGALVKCLQKRPGRQIVDAVKHFQVWLYNPFSPFGVVVDSWSHDPVLPEHPLSLIKAGRVQRLPWIASQTSSEGLYPGSSFYSDTLLKDMDTRWNEIMPFVLDYNFTVDPGRRDDVSQKIRNYYFGNKAVSKSTYMNLIQMLTDRHFDIDKYAQMHAAATAPTAPTYFYYFSYRGTNSYSAFTAGTNQDFGASHADDTSYIFKTKMDVQSTEEDKAMVQLFVDLFASFAETGNPKISVDWPTVSQTAGGSFTYLEIKSPQEIQIQTKEIIKKENRLFWDSLNLNENEEIMRAKDEL